MAILDHNGKPLTRQVALDEFGTTGLAASGGFIVEEWLPKLRGLRAVRVYREMWDNDAIVSAILLLIEMMIKQAEWRVEPAGEDNAQLEAAEFLESALDDMSHTWEDFLGEALSMLPFGWAYHETVYKIRRGQQRNPKVASSKFNDGRWGWRKIPIRSQDSLLKWEFDEEGGVRGMHQTALVTGQSGSVPPAFIPIEKAILFRTTSRKNSPEGRSMLRGAVRSYFFLKRMQEIEAIGIERDLAGYPVMEVPPEVLSKQASANQKALRTLAENIVRQIKRDEREGMVIPSEVNADGTPSQWKLKLLATGGRRQIVTNDIIRRYETRVAVSMLADFVMLGLDKVGIQSLASSKTHVFAKAAGGLMDNIQSTFNRFGVNRLMELNGFPEEVRPSLVHGDIETPPLDEIGSYLQSLTTAGIPVTDEPTQRKLREFGRLPEPDTDALNDDNFRPLPSGEPDDSADDPGEITA